MSDENAIDGVGEPDEVVDVQIHEADPEPVVLVTTDILDAGGDYIVIPDPSNSPDALMFAWLHRGGEYRIVHLNEDGKPYVVSKLLPEQGWVEEGSFASLDLAQANISAK